MRQIGPTLGLWAIQHYLNIVGNYNCIQINICFITKKRKETINLSEMICLSQTENRHI